MNTGISENIGKSTGFSMTADQFDRERFYQATLSTARVMRRQGLITDEELSLICAKMLGKYRPLLGSLSSPPLPK